MRSACMKALVLSIALLASGVSSAQVPTPVPETLESIGVIQDTDAISNNGVVRRRILGPLTRPFRVTDFSLDTRRVVTEASPCFFELWRGDATAPTAPVWSRVRIFNTVNSYDRSWVTGPTFAAGEYVWAVGYFDPLNTGLRTCTRFNPALPGELIYAVRGYLLK